MGNPSTATARRQTGSRGSCRGGHRIKETATSRARRTERHVPGALRSRARYSDGADLDRRVTVELNGRRLDVIRERRISADIDLRGLPKGLYTVKISVVTTTGRGSVARAPTTRARRSRSIRGAKQSFDADARRRRPGLPVAQSHGFHRRSVSRRKESRAGQNPPGSSGQGSPLYYYVPGLSVLPGGLTLPATGTGRQAGAWRVATVDP